MNDTNKSSIVKKQFNTLNKATSLISRGIRLSNSLSSTKINNSVRALCDKLNSFLEILYEYQDCWKSIAPNSRLSNLIKLRQQYSHIVELIGEITDNCIVDESSIIEIDDITELFDRMKKTLDEMDPSSPHFSVLTVSFYAAIYLLDSILPEGLTITKKSIWGLMKSGRL